MESSTLENHLTCPICFEIPPNEIIQCRKGHQICGACHKSLSNCPQCRIPYGTEDTRNLAMESLLDSMEFLCPFKGEGCPTKLARKDLDSHGTNCKFNPAIKLFCSRHLEWKDCKTGVDQSSVLSHMEEQHPVKKINCSTFQLGLDYREYSYAENLRVYFDPLVVTSLATPILLRTRSGHIVLTCFLFSETDEADVDGGCEFRVSYRIEIDKETDITWSGCVQPYLKFEGINKHNSFFIPGECAVEGKGKGRDQASASSAQPGGLSKKILIKVAMHKATDPVPSLMSGDFQKIYISEQVALPDDDQKSPGIEFPGFSCANCNVEPIKKVLYRCLQCNNYVLCSRCMEQGHHGQHIFVRVEGRNQSSFNEFTQWLRMAIPSQGYINKLK